MTNNKKCMFICMLILIFVFGIFDTTMAKEHIYLSMGTGSTGGNYYIWGNGMINIVNEKSDYIELSPESVSGSAHGARLVDMGQLDFCLAMPVVAYTAWRGIREFDEKHQNIRVAYALPSSGQAIVVKENSSIYSLGDLRGKLIAVNSANTEAAFIDYLEAYGLSHEKGDYKTRIMTYNEAATSLKDGVLDATVQSMFPPGGAFIELKSSIGVRVIFFPEDVIDKAREKFPVYPKLFISQDVIMGSDEDYESKIPYKGILGNDGAVLVHKDVPEEVVYDFAKLCFENLEELGKVSIQLLALDFDYIQKFIDENNSGIPWHPGALECLEEIGIKIPPKVREESF